MPYSFVLCSVKAMLLLMDCKDKMLLSNALALKNTGEDSDKKKKEVRIKLAAHIAHSYDTACPSERWDVH